MDNNVLRKPTSSIILRALRMTVDEKHTHTSKSAIKSDSKEPQNVKLLSQFILLILKKKIVCIKMRDDQKAVSKFISKTGP